MATPLIAAEPPRVLAVFAHPDDEIVVAPALAAAARGGAHVRIVYATAGDAAAPETRLQPGAAIAALRTGEARCAARALGAVEPIMLGFGDGKLGEIVRPPAATLTRLREAIAAVIATERPDIVVTWGPDGGYGHPDHRLVSAVVTELLASRAQRPLLLHAALAAGSVPPVPEMDRWAVEQPELITVRTAHTPGDLAATAKAVDCHKSQFSAVIRAGLVPLFAGSVWKDGVAFRAPLDPARGDVLGRAIAD
ncbi:PIG-L family deacetylase [Qipengyuania sediminis]|uniref:PIG-L family deacetylase n=1 Tax=Qipengyuania sediminis TaxID=1532023 RepID=UPI00140442BA|nr:PIG-L family deacetylase [Qipengyuania sediminis]